MLIAVDVVYCNRDAHTGSIWTMYTQPHNPNTQIDMEQLIFRICDRYHNNVLWFKIWLNPFSPKIGVVWARRLNQSMKVVVWHLKYQLSKTTSWGVDEWLVWVKTALNGVSLLSCIKNTRGETKAIHNCKQISTNKLWYKTCVSTYLWSSWISAACGPFYQHGSTIIPASITKCGVKLFTHSWTSTVAPSPSRLQAVIWTLLGYCQLDP